MSLLLGVNVDHVATLRQARYALDADSPLAEPSPLEGALAAMRGGADSITIHVRGDRRHMQERDAFEIREKCPLPLNFEMGNTREMLAIVERVKPDFVCLVPEKREEVTTEGGLGVVEQLESIRETVGRLQGIGSRVSLFIDPDVEQVEAAGECGAEMVELHTGCYANAVGLAVNDELERIRVAGERGEELGLQVNAGHGIHFKNVESLISFSFLKELNIGHSLISRAIFVGLEAAVREMREAMDGGV
ncbi:MAG: pyridoxine 5'-phosphate synthase [Verrucomicrobiota bacterium]